MSQSEKIRRVSRLLLIAAAIFLLRASPAATEPALDPAQQQAVLMTGLQAMQGGDAGKAMAMAEILMRSVPASEDGYNLAAMIYFTRRDFTSVVAVSQLAKSRGVQSLFLAKYLTQALYFLGDFASSLQGFDRAEKILRAEMNMEKEAKVS